MTVLSRSEGLQDKTVNQVRMLLSRLSRSGQGCAEGGHRGANRPLQSPGFVPLTAGFWRAPAEIEDLEKAI